MKIFLYTYKGRRVTYDLGRDDVAALHVIVLSGDEVATVVFSDGSTKKYDSALDNPRVENRFDGDYTLTTDREIMQWLSLTPPCEACILSSYKRLEFFTKSRRKED
ncbi:MAG: hypothetical protein ACLRKZ_05205 [Acutalibacteraceae bacterium]